MYDIPVASSIILPEGTCAVSIERGDGPERKKSVKLLSTHFCEEVVSKRTHVPREFVHAHVICFVWRKQSQGFDDVVAEMLNCEVCAVC